MSKYIYLVTTGTYSDYRVRAAFASKKRADAWVKALQQPEDDEDGYAWDSDARVERYEILSAVPQRVKYYNMSVTIWDSGRVEEGRVHVSEQWDIDAGPPVTWRWVRAPVHDGKGGRLDVDGTDRDRVAKVCSEKKALLLTDPVARGSKELVGK